MNRRILFGFLFMFVLAGCGPRVPDVRALVGHWAPVSAELGGQDLPVKNFGGATLRMTSEAFDFGNRKGKYKILSLKPPAQMDITVLDGPLAGHVTHAIFRLVGDRLTICYQIGADARPSEFSSPKGSKILLIRYKRMP